MHSLVMHSVVRKLDRIKFLILNAWIMEMRNEKIHKK